MTARSAVLSVALFGTIASGQESPQAAPATELLPPPGVVREIRRATILRMLGKVDLGLAVLEDAARAHPDQMTPLLAMLDYGREAGFGAEASARVRERIRARLAEPGAVVDLGTLSRAVETHDVPREDLELLREGVTARLRASPEDADMYELAAYLESRLGNLGAAREALLRAVALRPTVAREERLIELDSTLGRWDDVIARTRALLDRRPDDVPRRMDLARALARTGRADEAARVAEPLAEREWYRWNLAQEVWIPLGWRFRDEGDDVRAEAAFRKALALAPGHSVAETALAEYYASDLEREMGRKADDERLSKVTNPFPLIREGATRLASGDSAGALPLLRKATELADDDPVAWYNRGLAAQGVGAWPEASEAYGRTTELAPDMAEGWLGMGRVAHQEKRLLEAIAHLERALRLRPDLRSAHGLLAQCHQALGDVAKALEHQRRYEEMGR